MLKVFGKKTCCTRQKKNVKFLKVGFFNFENFDSVFRANYPDKEEQTSRNLKEKKLESLFNTRGALILKRLLT